MHPDIHTVKKDFDDIKVNECIEVYDTKGPLKVVKKNKKSLCCRQLNSPKSLIKVWYKDYLWSYVVTPDYMKADAHHNDFCGGFCVAEKMYGINHHGSEDPDPIRQLAFKILKGDPIAIDIAMDVLGRGG